MKNHTKEEIRRYYAAHAPKKVPSWFKPVMPPEPESMVLPSWHFLYHTSKEEKILYQFFNEEGSTQEEQWPSLQSWHTMGHTRESFTIIPQKFKDKVTQYLKDYDTRQADRQDYDRCYQIELLTQWPFHYAELMMAKDEKHSKKDLEEARKAISGELWKQAKKQ